MPLTRRQARQQNSDPTSASTPAPSTPAPSPAPFATSDADSPDVIDVTATYDAHRHRSSRGTPIGHQRPSPVHEPVSKKARSSRKGNDAVPPAGAPARHNADNQSGSNYEPGGYDTDHTSAGPAEHDTGEPTKPEDDTENLACKVLLPDNFMVIAGNKTVFQHELISEEKVIFTGWDMHKMSLSRYVSDPTVVMSADLLMRQYGCFPEKGWALMHETAHIQNCLEPTKISLSKLSLERMETIVTSKVLLVPIFTESAKHWSLLVMLNLDTIFNIAMQWRAKSGPLRKPSRSIPQPIAIHMDSLSSSNHRKKAANIYGLLGTFISNIWKIRNEKEFERRRIAPAVSAYVSRTVKMISGKVDQQSDGITCGWRTVDSVRIVSEYCGREGDIPDGLQADVPSQYLTLARRFMRYGQAQMTVFNSDIPSILFPVHDIVDRVCCTAFNASISNVNEKMVTFFDVKQDGNESNRNTKKIAQARKFAEIYDIVGKEMKDRGFDKRRKGGRISTITEEHCKAIAKHVLFYPRGRMYSSCIYYTRHNYPDSILVHTGLNVLMDRNPRLFGSDFRASGGRLTQSRLIHFRMGMHLDFVRSTAKNWDKVARFRLQELVLHFQGLAEAVVKASFKEAEMVSAGIGTTNAATGTAASTGANITEESNLTDEDGNDQFQFSSAFTVETGDGENGVIRCSVPAKALGTNFCSCLILAEKVANEGIMTAVKDFEAHCKRIRKVMGSSSSAVVTGQSMASIHAIFKNAFTSKLVTALKEKWGHVLDDHFVANTLKPALSSLLTTVDKIFNRNGVTFLDLSHDQDLLLQETIVPRATSDRKRLRQQEKNAITTTVTVPVETTRNNTVGGPSTHDDESQAAVINATPVSFKTVRSFGLGARIFARESKDVERQRDQLLVLISYLLSKCKAHRRLDAYHCRVLGITLWGLDLPKCQILLQEVWETFSAAVREVGQSFDANSDVDEKGTFLDHIRRLKFDIVVETTTMIADTQDVNSQHRVSKFKSDLFCYEVPRSSRGGEGIEEGEKFEFFADGERQEAVWHSIASSVDSRKMDMTECGISVSEGKAFINNVLIEQEKVPSMHVINVTVEVQCNCDLWSDGDIEADPNSYLGFRVYDCVGVLFSFHNGTMSDAPRHPLQTNYEHSFFGVVLNRTPITMGRRAPQDKRNYKFVGPKLLELKIMVHDNLPRTSNGQTCLRDLVQRWSRKADKFSFCYVMPLRNMSLRQAIYNYVSLGMAQDLPKPIILALLDPSMASAYEDERRQLHYLAMKHTNSRNDTDRPLLPSRQVLEGKNRDLIQKACVYCDPSLNSEQIEIIQNVLYGYKTTLTPNNEITLEGVSEPFKTFLSTCPHVAKMDTQWWGSRLCFIRGPPGTGKTRMLAALIATILEYGAEKPRILVVCETNRALDEIFLKVLALFKRNRAKYQQVYESLLRVGSSSSPVVRKRELQGGDSVVLASSRVVFTTFGSSYRRELHSNPTPFSFIFVEESCLVEEPALINSLVMGCGTAETSENYFRKVTVAAIGDNNQLHKMKINKSIIPTKCQSHFFDRAWQKDVKAESCTNVMSLRQQYRMNPALASFISSQFYNGDLETPADGDKQWKDDDVITSLRRHTLFPIRNVVVVDTSTEGAAANESLGPDKSFYNSFEVRVIISILQAWCDAIDRTTILQKVTIITTYAKQRTEISNKLTAAGFNNFRVCTVDELQGGDNDIIILSLVRAKITKGTESTSRPGPSIGFVADPQRANVALSRAKQGMVVIGCVSHIASQSSVWHNFFKECADKSSGEVDGTHGYFRLRYVHMNRDLRFEPFSPPYLK